MAEDILLKIANATRKRIDQKLAEESLTLMQTRAIDAQFDPIPSFEDALRTPEISFICECKKASPSKGIIAEDFPYLDIARDYEAAGAAAISCLTEPEWFMGKPEYLRGIANEVSIPVLRKDFIIDPYQIYEARALGASAILLICSILSTEELTAFSTLAHELGMSTLIEAHDEEEIARALAADATIIGVNNRNLHDFTIDFDNSIRLRSLVPDNVVFVTESGIKTADDIKLLQDHGVNAVLIGETLMKAPDKKAALSKLRGAAG